MRRSRADTKVQLAEHFERLERRCNDYDNGHLTEAKSIAVLLRTVFHDGRTSRSLVTQLDGWSRMINSSSVDAPGVGFPRLVQLRLSSAGSATFLAPLGDRACQPVSASVWWTKDEIFRVGGEVLYRQSFVRWVADRDGGAHVDEELPDVYVLLARQGGGWAQSPIQRDGATGCRVQRVGAANLARPASWIPAQVDASLRQMAYEVLTSDSLLQLAR